jgi:hypothetical protein
MSTPEVFDIAAIKQRWDAETALRRRVSRQVSRIVRNVDATARAEYVTGRGSWTQWIARPRDNMTANDVYHALRRAFVDTFGTSTVRDRRGRLYWGGERFEVRNDKVGVVVSLIQHETGARVVLSVMFHEEV